MILFTKTGREMPYESDKDLNFLANRLETDKGNADSKTLSWGISYSENFCWAYTETYKKYMDDFREKEIKFLEIGICDPRFKYASPKLWLQYFKNVDLYCMDNFWGDTYLNEINSIESINKMGVNFIYGDQYSEDDWDSLDKFLGAGSLNFIVEDGSHYPNHMMYSLWRSINLMKPGGYYFMEDIQNPNTSKAKWGYDNADISISLNDFMNSKKLTTQYLSAERCLDIENQFEFIDLILDKTQLNYLAVFRKK